MTKQFAIAITLLFQAAASLTNATAETMTLEDFLKADPDTKSATADPAVGNPLADIDFKVTPGVSPTPAEPKGAQALIVVIENGPVGHTAFLMDYRPDANVGSILRKAQYPRPINFASTKIAVHRPRHHVNEDLTVEAEEQILRVDWDSKANQPTKKSNHRLQPNDRIVVTLPPATAVPIPTPMLVPAAAPYPPPPVIAAQSIPALPHPPHAPETWKAVHYSALPASVPSPYQANPTVSLAQVVAEVPVEVRESLSPAPTTAVKFNVVVLEDTGDSFAEFHQLRSQMPFMLTDTATIEGTLRILQKHNLVQTIANPKMIVVAGEEGTFEVGTETPGDKVPWTGTRATMGARELGGGLAVDFKFELSADGRVDAVTSSLIVPHGQSVIMKTGSQSPEAAKDDDAARQKSEHAVYVVLTPEIVR
jgi:hypothetical protein